MTDVWTLASSATPDELARAFREALPARHLHVVDEHDSDGPRSIASIYANSEGAHLIVWERPDLTLAHAITNTLGSPTRLLMLRFDDASVAARLIHYPDGTVQDLNEAAYETLHEWYDGKPDKILSESYDGLAEALLEIEGHPSDGDPVVVVYFRSTLFKRVALLVQEVRSGGRWERIAFEGRSGIRVTGPNGTQIAVLTPEQEAEFLAAIGGG